MNKREKALKGMAILAKQLTVFPLFAVIEAITFEQFSFLRICLYAAITLCALLLGWYFAYGVERQRKLHKDKAATWGTFSLRVLSGLCCALLFFAGAALAAWFNQNHMLYILMGAAAVYSYLHGFHARDQDFSRVYSAFSLGLFIVATFVCFVLIGQEGNAAVKHTARQSIVVNMLVCVMIMGIVLNQINIESEIARRSDIHLLMPRRLRKNNFLLLLVVTAAFGVCFLFRDALAAFFQTIYDAVLGVILGWLNSIMDSALLEESVQQTEAPLLTAEDMQASMILQRILDIILLILAVLFIYKFGRSIVRGIIRFIKRVIELLSQNQREEKTREKPAYIDYVEEIEKNTGRKTDTLHRLVKRYKRERDPEKKLRLSYRILLQASKENRLPVLPSETVTEQIQKSAVLLQRFSESEKYKDWYERVRYAEESADSEALRLSDELVRSLTHK